MTLFIGRAQERSALQSLLEQEDVRLITLTGPGGVGKTRLALRVAADLHHRYPEGVVFAPLAALAEALLFALGVEDDWYVAWCIEGAGSIAIQSCEWERGTLLTAMGGEFSMQSCAYGIARTSRRPKSG